MISMNSILGLVLSKVQTFVVLYDSKASTGPTRHVFLVHGFRDTQFNDHRNVLERWVVEEVRKATDSQRIIIWAFRFDMVKSLTRDDNASLREESQALRTHLLCLYEQEEPRPEDINEYSTDKSDGSTRDARPQSIVFIAHGLGSWIVKEVLAMRNSRNFAFYPMGLIQVDARREESYSDYISRLYSAFKVQQPSESTNDSDDQVSPDLFLRRADNNFVKYKEFYYHQQNDPKHSRGSQTVYEKQLPDIWMSDPPLIPLLVASWGEWFHGRSRSTSLQFDILNQLKLEKKFRKAISKRENLSNSQVLNALNQGFEASTEDNEVGSQYLPPLKENQAADDTDDPDIDENMAVMSDTVNDMTQEPSVDLNRLARLANSFYQRSDFTDADRLYVQYYNVMPRTRPPSTAQIQVLIKILILRIHRGKYGAASRLLEIIKGQIREARADSGREEELNQVQRQRRRWLATYLCRIGRWKEAVEMLNKLSTDSWSLSQDDNVQRDLALAYAYLGRHDEAEHAIKLAEHHLKKTIEQSRAAALNLPSLTPSDDVPPTKSNESLLNRRDSQESNDDMRFSVREQGINTVFAQVHLGAGDFEAALDLSSRALDTMKRILGTKHVKTLMTANIKSRCLAYAARYSEAEPLCLSTLDFAKKKLGSKHPIYLEALELLVYIFRYQDRYPEAIDTGTVLLESWPDEIPEDHPLAILCKYQLGTAHLENGDYATAEKLLTGVTNQAELSFGKLHPDHLRYRSRLAYALFCSGKRHQARKEIIETAILQMDFYKIAPSDSSVTGDSKTSVGKRSDFDMILDRLKKFDPATTKARLHPFLILTMRLLVRIEAGVTKTDTPDFKKNIINELQRIISRPKSSTTADLVLIAAVRYDLVLALQEVDPSEDNLTRCIDLLKSVIKERSKALGEGHLDTLSAKRDLIITTFTRDLSRSAHGESSDISPENAETLSMQILDSMQASVGEYHPEAIKSQLWCITVKLLSPKTEAELEAVMEEVDNIMKRMRSPSLRSERLIDCLELGLKMASRLSALELNEKAHQVLQATLSETEDAIRDESNSSIRPALEEILDSLKALATS